MTWVLGIDCAGGACSVAVVSDGQPIAARDEAMERGQAALLLPMIKDVLAAAQLELDAIDLIAVTVGPGSFTGVRIGLAAARGLALGAGLPLIGVTCFDAVANIYPQRPLAIALESKRAELFLQIHAAMTGEAALVPPEAWDAFIPSGPIHLAGDGAGRLMASVTRTDIVLADPPAVSLATAAARVGAGLWTPGTVPPRPLPLYLRAPDTTASKKIPPVIR